VTAATRTIIVRIENIQVALLVDSITYVLALLPNEIENQNLPGKGTGAEFISRIGKHGKRVLGVLDLNKIYLAASGGKLAGEQPAAA
jgi:chemotaxis signal transduction protein